VGVALLVSVPAPVGRGAPAAALSFTAAPPPTGQNIQPYDTAVRQAFAQVRAWVAASADLKAVPSNLEPPLAHASAELKDVFFNGCLLNYFWEMRQPECATGDTASTTTVALVGDSHATMLAPAFQHVAAQRHWRLEILGKAACPPMSVPITNPIHHLLSNLCEQWHGQTIARLRAEHPRLVVVSMYRQYGADGIYLPGFKAYDPVWIDTLTHLVQELRSIGAKVLVLGPVPDPHSVVPICLSGHLDDVTACSPPRSTAVNEHGIAAETAATQAGGGQYADLTDLFCTADRCPVIIGNNLVYFDKDHLTAEYTRLLAPVMGALADRVLAGD
jgi:hypothetical protein